VFCITSNEANVILLFILTEDAPIRDETRLRLSHNEVNKSCWYNYLLNCLILICSPDNDCMRLNRLCNTVDVKLN
jgi:hypothetical protein